MKTKIIKSCVVFVDGAPIVCNQGQVIELPDKQAAELAELGWAEIEKPPKKAPKAD